MYCANCGKTISDMAKVCPDCGHPNTPAKTAVSVNASSKSKMTAILLCWFLGCFGIHRFYVGKIGTGILMLCTFGGLCVWTVIDLIRLICNKFEDKDGNVICN